MSKQRRSHHEEHENHERWIVSYADFITLLFAFFVVLYATSTKNEDKEKKFEESIQKELKMLVVGNQQAGGPPGNPLGSVIDSPDVFFRKGVGPGELEDHVERMIDKQISSEEKKQLISNIRHDAIGVRVSLAATTLFPVGSSKLKQPSLKTLDKLAELLQKAPQKLIVEGHTDNIPVAGGLFESNWELAAARATQVVRYLIKVHGFDPKRLAAISYADQKPISSNDTEEGRSQNRRIEFLIVTENQGE